MHHNLPCSPSMLEDQQHIASTHGEDTAEAYIMSDMLLRDHLRSIESREADPLFTIDVMERVMATAPAPSKLSRLISATPVIGAITFVFTLGFVFGFVAGGIPSPHDVMQWITTDLWAYPYVLWGAIGVLVLGIGVWQMETS